MSKTSELIDEIHENMNEVNRLSQQIHERYRVIGALLLSAKSLVPEHRWNSWVTGNLELDTPTVETIISAEEPSLEITPKGIMERQVKLLDNNGNRAGKTAVKKGSRKKSGH